jgi:hypothetical protein
MVTWHTERGRYDWQPTTLFDQLLHISHAALMTGAYQRPTMRFKQRFNMHVILMKCHG